LKRIIENTTMKFMHTPKLITVAFLAAYLLIRTPWVYFVMG